MRRPPRTSSVKIIACRLISTKPSCEPMLEYCIFDPFSEILIEIYTFSFKKMFLNMSSGKWQPFCLGLKVFKGPLVNTHDQLFITGLVQTGGKMKGNCVDASDL